jgi:hypothetical protein
MRFPNQTPQQRKQQIETALERLNKALAIGEIKLKVGANGAVTFLGAAWLKKEGISDTCAYRKLLAQGSPALKQAQMAAERLAGRKVDAHAVAAGVHSHDGGNTWHKGHK